MMRHFVGLRELRELVVADNFDGYSFMFLFN
jgi:hypothetical protein